MLKLCFHYKHRARCWGSKKRIYQEGINEKENVVDYFDSCHAYSHVNALSSAARAYMLTKDKKYLDVIEIAYHAVLQIRL